MKAKVSNPFSKRHAPNKWVAPASVLMLAIGFLVSLAWSAQENRATLINSLPPDMRNEVISGNLDLANEVSKLRSEVTKLRSDKSRLETTLANQGSASKELNESLKESRVFAGLTGVEGPGVIVTLSDSRKTGEELLMAESGIIHFLDVLKVVNELWNAGAEAIDVNGHRVGPGTNFRCVGSVILVDTVKIASPVAIRAVGDNKTLYGAINLPGGALEELRQVDPGMVKVETVKALSLPPYDGTTTHKYAKPVESGQ